MLSHVDADGRPQMVEVGPKAVTRRSAQARALVVFPVEVMTRLLEGQTGRREPMGPKGPVFATAIVAGIQAVKRTWDLIPLCHPLPIEGIAVDCRVLEPDSGPPCEVEILCRVTTTYKTGVEMEALTGASVATAHPHPHAPSPGWAPDWARLAQQLSDPAYAPDRGWHCDACGAPAREWTPICQSCEAVDAVEWRLPKTTAAAVERKTIPVKAELLPR